MPEIIPTFAMQSVAVPAETAEEEAHWIAIHHALQ